MKWHVHATPHRDGWFVYGSYRWRITAEAVAWCYRIFTNVGWAWVRRY